MSKPNARLDLKKKQEQAKKKKDSSRRSKRKKASKYRHISEDAANHQKNKADPQFQCFAKERRKTLMKKSEGNLSYSEATSLIAEEWSNKSDAEKSLYNENQQVCVPAPALAPMPVKIAEDKRTTVDENSVNPLSVIKVTDSDDDEDIPIFTKEFLQYNKKKETQYQQLVKTTRDLNQSNRLMQHNEETWKRQIAKAQERLDSKQKASEQSKDQLDDKYNQYKMQFQHIRLPTRPDLDVVEHTFEYVDELTKILHNNNPDYHNFMLLAYNRLQDIYNI